MFTVFFKTLHKQLFLFEYNLDGYNIWLHELL